jgi:hypothetical protein
LISLSWHEQLSKSVIQKKLEMQPNRMLVVSVSLSELYFE